MEVVAAIHGGTRRASMRTHARHGAKAHQRLKAPFVVVEYSKTGVLHFGERLVAVVASEQALLPGGIAQDHQRVEPFQPWALNRGGGRDEAADRRDIVQFDRAIGLLDRARSERRRGGGGGEVAERGREIVGVAEDPEQQSAIGRVHHGVQTGDAGVERVAGKGNGKARPRRVAEDTLAGGAVEAFGGLLAAQFDGADTPAPDGKGRTGEPKKSLGAV
ncbi:MAG: hypothetical protein IPJ98_09655 [Bryobacterales bacterium]|nr:hypothetical protein [Bryobacterales bacterium]